MFGLHIYRLAGNGMLILDGANTAADTILRVHHRSLLGKPMEEAFPAFCGKDLPARCRQVAVAGGEFHVTNFSYAHAEGQAILNFSVVSTEPNRLTIAFHDVSAQQRAEIERERLLAHLTQAQKLESIGQLAGGVVHDFNNLLQCIMGQMELCRDELGASHPVHAHLGEIATEAQRSARLVKQLLSFVSQKTITPQRLDANEAITSMLKLLRRLLGEKIELVWRSDVPAGMIYMDPSQFDQILINLAVNARDAIQDVGQLTIETSLVTLDRQNAGAHPGLTAGAYVRITLRDTGCGMDAATQARMFEPFFTTKPAGQSSGLGLTTVQRIIHENHGTISVQSKQGQGSVFDVYLPRLVEEVTASMGPADVPLVGGCETILLVEDDKIVRRTTCRMLQKLGYTVLTAESPEEALRLVAEQTAPIHLLLTDVMLPGASGRDLAAKLKKEYPALKCLFMSGHSDDVIANRGQGFGIPNFIAKPFSRHMFAIKLREILDAQVAA